MNTRVYKMIAKVFKTCLLILLVSHMTSFITENEAGFKIIGSAVGFLDSSKLFLEYHIPDGKKRVDSVYIIDGEFTFTGELKSKVVYALIRTRDYKNYKFLWIENSTISFKAESGKFRNAIITGSFTQDEQNELDSLLMSVDEIEKKEKYINFISTHPKSMISGHLLSVYGSAWGKQTTAALYDKLSTEIKTSPYGKMVMNFISLNGDLKLGDGSIDFSQMDERNRMVKLSDFYGKIVLLEFWGSWCKPCRLKNPELVKIYGEFKDRGFEILGVGAETNKEAWIRAIKEDKLPWINVTDLKGDRNEAALIYGVSAYPTNFLIDKTGKIIYRDLEGDALRKKLEDVLKER